MEYWDKPTLKSRITDWTGRKRFLAGAPDEAEVDAYLAALPPVPGMALVLGMTPELRTALLDNGWRVIAADRNAQAIELYRDWVPVELADRETLREIDWRELPRGLENTVDVILGDGVFGNLSSVPAHQEMLEGLNRCLRPGGRMVFRQALLPDTPLAHWRAENLLQAFREGRLEEAGFGLAMRLFGVLDEAYDATGRLLDNARVFQLYGRWREIGKITAWEHGIILRYYFGGQNSLLPRAEWEALLARAGFEYARIQLSGRSWYAWYPLYELFRHPDG